WPSKSQDWGRLPQVDPLDNRNIHRGFSIVIGGSTESWLYNTSGKTTAAGDLEIEGNDAGDIGIRRTSAGGQLERLVLQGSGILKDQNGQRTLLDLKTQTGA